MKRASIVLIAMVGLSACQSKPVNEMSYTEQNAWAAGIVKKCKEQRVPEREMQACLRVEALRDAAARQNSAERSRAAGLALAAGMQSMGASMQAGGATYRPPVNCTSRLAGTNVGQPTQIMTSCY